jgi:hypothetical protein
MGTATLRAWSPTKEEVERIVAEMRPIIAELARHQVFAPEAVRK